MTTTKVTLSIDSTVYKEFKEIKIYKSLSISAWITAMMQKEVEDYKQDMLCKLQAGIEIAKAMFMAGMRLDVIKEKLIPIYGDVKTNEILKTIKE